MQLVGWWHKEVAQWISGMQHPVGAKLTATESGDLLSTGGWQHPVTIPFDNLPTAIRLKLHASVGCASRPSEHSNRAKTGRYTCHVLNRIQKAESLIGRKAGMLSPLAPAWTRWRGCHQQVHLV